MSLLNRWAAGLKRSNSPLARFLKGARRSFYYPTLPPLPRALFPLLRAVYGFHFLVVLAFRWILAVCYCNPLFQSQCVSFGRRVWIGGLPFVTGPVQIHIGNGVVISEKVSIMSGYLCETPPELVIKDRAEIGINTIIMANREVVIEEHARISWDCRISDSDGHPREADRRAAGEPPDPEDIRPVRIGRYAWIGNGTHIMKGVVIGEGAIVGANSVVITSVPPYALAMGNPAEVLFRNTGKPRNPFPPAQAAE